MNCELADVQAGFKKGRATRDQIANIHWITEKARKFQKKHLLLITDYAKIFDCVDHYKLWKILKEMGIADHLSCLLRNLYAGQEATVRTRHGTMDGSKLGKEYVKAVYCHPVIKLLCRVEVEVLASQSCLTVRNPKNCSPPGSSVHGIFQARILE